MANTRKVLINRHSTKPQAPLASEMYLGEIAISHPSDLSATTIFTKNGDMMIPFASCAMTQVMIDNAIADADVSYEVKKADGEAFINVDRSVNGSAITFTISSDDVQSEEEFDEYTAATETKINNVADALDALTNIVVTGISGDSIIVAEVQNPTTGTNYVSLTHKQALAANGFNKLATDAYGHVTASTAVSTSDIEALGFKNSADTADEIEAAIEALSAVSASTGKYLTAIGVNNGKLVKEEANLPVLDVESSGSGNVVATISVDGHKISYTTASVATSEGIAELSGAVISLSAATTAISEDLEALSGIVGDFSAATVAEFDSAFTAIQGMDKAADVVAGKVVTTVAQEDGKVTETKANVKDLQLGGYVKDTTATGAIAGTDTINAALSKLENIVAANEISNADGSINVTAAATGTDINVEIKTNDPILAKDGGNGVYSTLNLVKITTGLPATVKERYELQGISGAKIGEDIDIAKDSHIVSITFISDPSDAHYQNLMYKYIDADGDEQTEYIDVSSLVLEAEFANGVGITNHVAHGVVDPTSESFLTVGGDGFKLSGVQDAIDAKVNALDVTGDTAVAGQYVAAIEQTDGVVAVKTRANVSEAVLTNYAKGTDGSAVAATDSVRESIGKLENQIDAAKAAATTKVVEGTDAGNNMAITPTTGADGSVTYTVDLTDVASATALTAEIAARKAVDGQNGDTYAANANTNFISNATSLNDADVKLDAAIKAVSGDAETAIAAAIAGLDSTGATSDSGHYLTSVTITDGRISAVGQEALPAGIPISATTATPVNTASAVLTGVTASGADNHELTFGMSNKVFSASSSESADVATNAVHASAATKVDSALTLTDVAGTNNVVFDGSVNKTVTFGTATSVTGENSMTMSNAGVVDVNIIDCGTY